ncbi:MAG: LPS export ABC transporter periplasmic protein LptC [Gallionella sp.]
MTFASRIRYWLPLLPLLGLLGGTYWLNQQVQPDPVPPTRTDIHEPDAIVENFSAIQLGKSGTPRFILTANKMQHFPFSDNGNDTATLTSPRITIMTPEHPPIHSASERGTISGKGDVVYLYGNVEILRNASAQRDELRAHTEYLHIIPGKSLISTNKAVSITEGANTLHATGLEIDNNAHTIKLLSNVRAEYVSGKH